ncbi:hypothetical protein [uncultured Stenotrophomonas sp.]|uniref:hypothetical protein n=1 Tax=uncultured Stenotrophomonas sp. TaxID=165438 RepID=UPI0025D3984C|nr:hypothetical protein [uncultured Stenotrophomonas sp.]
MRVLLTTTIAAALITGCSTAPGVIHGRTVELHRESSVAGESLDDFVVRIAPHALESSKTARATACGQIEQDADIFSVQLKTDGYVSDCGLPRSGQPYVLINGTATSASENHFSLVNRNRPGYLITPWAVKYQDASGRRTVSSF